MAVIRAALIGHPVAHSLSPVLHRAAARACGVDFEYDLFDTPPAALEPTLARLQADGYAGYNVTAPHKSAVFARVQPTPVAQGVGAVNTVVLDPSGATGHNTDVPGFAAALAAEHPPDGPAVVLGAGGAARAAVASLSASGRPFTVVARRPAQARALHHRTAGWGTIDLHGAALVVNCTARAAADAVAALPFHQAEPGALLYDLNYGAAARPVLSAASHAGMRAVDGLGMLAWQGILAFALWTGHTPPAGPVLTALRAAAASIDTR